MKYRSISKDKAMTSQSNIRRLQLVLAISATLLTTACSKPQPQPPSSLAPAAPASSSSAGMPAGMDHSAMATGAAGQAMDPAMPMAAATAEVSGAFGSGKPVTVTLHVTDMMSGKPMGADSFEIAHTKKIHVLGVDPSLTDYSHSHPAPSAKPGDWSFTFTPKFNRPYHLWLDVKAVGGAQEFVLLTVNANGAMAAVEKTSSLVAKVGDVSATLAFDAPLVAGQAAMGRLEIQRGDKPFAALEPVMGAYSHIVGISEDWKTIAHVHPMGTEPTRESDRGGPAIDFHLEPRNAGFLKLFAQIQVDGHDVFLPFAVTVGDTGSGSASPADPDQAHLH